MKKRILLIALLYLNGIAATLGGIGLMMNKLSMPDSYLTHTDFASFYFPGVILFAIVGGSSLLAAIATQKRLVGSGIATVLAGLIMLFWLVGEIVSIRELHALQFVFLLSGSAVIALTPKQTLTRKNN